MIVAKTRLKKMPKTCKQCHYRMLYPVGDKEICRIAGLFFPWEKKPNGMVELVKPDWCPLMEVAPTIDAVEVVRCRECKWWHEDDDVGHCDNPDGLDNYAKPTDFCSCGDRKGGDDR